jgi:peptidoglycan/LPS O-acetylase OafA/YrhL
MGLFPWSVFVVLTASVAAGWLSYWVIEYPTGKLRALHDNEGRPRDYYPELTAPAAPVPAAVTPERELVTVR